MCKKILIADDEPNIVRLLLSRLKANGYEVVAASDATQAIAKIHQEKPDLVILDIRMPAGGGMTVSQNLRNSLETSSIPIIFITAHPNDELRMKAERLGGVGFLGKPFNANELLDLIKKTIAGNDPDDRID